MPDLFETDSRILSSSIWLKDSELSTIYIKNESNFPWFILVPRVKDCQEIIDLNAEQRHILMEEIAMLSNQINNYYQPDKLNVGALGNIVSQLHIHVVARFKNDVLWPHGIWQPAFTSKLYDESELARIVKKWQKIL